MDNRPLLLLVEDEPLIRVFLTDALQEGGFASIESQDGTEALAELDSGKSFAGLITDIRVGAGPNGWDLARHARHLFPALIVVYITGDSGSEWTSEGVPNSILLQKPFATSQLITAVATLLNADIAATHPQPQPPSV